MPVIEDYTQQSGNGGPEIPVEGTAQNNFRAYKWFRCKVCNGFVHEPELSSHVCQGDGSSD